MSSTSYLVIMGIMSNCSDQMDSHNQGVSSKGDKGLEVGIPVGLAGK